VVDSIQKFVFLHALVFFGLFLHESLAHASVLNSNPITQTSEFEESATDAWALPGIRIGLSYEFNMLASLGYQPRTLTNGFSIRPYYRFENDWGIGATMTYDVPLINNTGLRWSLVMETTWWFFDQLGISVGAGYTGLMLSCDQASSPCTQTLPSQDGKPPLQEDLWLEEGEELNTCTGGGVILTTRIDYKLPVATYFATGPYIQSYYETVRCEHETGSTHPDTGQIIHYLDAWSYFGVGAGWWFTWR
jgi:hypothetical protein